MKKMSFFLITILCLLPVLADEDEGVASASFTSPVSTLDKLRDNDLLYQRLMDRHVPGSEHSAIDIEISEDDWNALTNVHEDKLTLGKTRDLDIPIDVSDITLIRSKKPVESLIGVAQPNAHGFVWTGMIRAEGSRGIRLYLEDFNLPEGARLYVYSDLGQAFGPYTGMGSNDTGAFWTDTVFADVMWLQIEVDAGTDSEDLSFTIDKLAHFGENFRMGVAFMEFARNKTCQGSGSLASCYENAKCYSSDLAFDLRRSVAWISYKSDSDGFWYGCTGSLINSTRNPGHKWFITAAHCVNSSTEADSLEAYFDYRTNSCKNVTSGCGSAFDGANKVKGAKLWTTNSSSHGDYSLLELDKYPNGSYTRLGWTSTSYVYKDGETLYRVSHPLHYPQAYSEHVVDSTVGTCNGDRPAYVYTYHTLGYTEGGSSGAPLVNSDSRIVGTDRGRCAKVQCSDTTAMRDGSFAYQYYDRLRPYLNPTDLHIENIVVTQETSNGKYRAKVQVQVLDTKDVPVAHAIFMVNISGPIPFVVPGVSGSDGWFTVYGPWVSTSSTWTACPQFVSHPWSTLNTSQNAENCDTN